MNNTTITIKDNKEALARLSDYQKMGHELLFFNGAQWYIKANENCVIVMDTGDNQNIRLSIGSSTWSRRYLENNTINKNFQESLELYKNAIYFG